MIEVKDVNGKLWTTTDQDWGERTLVNGLVVWVKLVPDNNGTLIAITQEEAAAWNIDQVYEATSKKAKKPKMKDVNAEKDKIIRHLDLMKAVRKKFFDPTRQLGVSAFTPKEAPKKAKGASKKTYTTADFLSHEAAALKKKKVTK